LAARSREGWRGYSPDPGRRRPRPMGGSPPVARAAAAPMPRTRRQAVPAATVPQRRARTDGRAVLRLPGSLSPRKITIKGAPGARRRFAAQTLDSDLTRQDLGTYQEDGRELAGVRIAYAIRFTCAYPRRGLPYCRAN
jgi:hypothetical protein